MQAQPPSGDSIKFFSCQLAKSGRKSLKFSFDTHARKRSFSAQKYNSPTWKQWHLEGNGCKWILESPCIKTWFHFGWKGVFLSWSCGHQHSMFTHIGDHLVVISDPVFNIQLPQYQCEHLTEKDEQISLGDSSSGIWSLADHNAHFLAQSTIQLELLYRVVKMFSINKHSTKLQRTFLCQENSWFEVESILAENTYNSIKWYQLYWTLSVKVWELFCQTSSDWWRIMQR